MPSSPSARPDAARVAFLRRRPFAHRGLHGAGVVENSRAAFARAIAAGQGIECDVQAASDGTAFVFHDDRLDRLTDAAGPVAALDPEQLDRIRLTGTDEALPRLTGMLTMVAGRVPILIELKTRRGAIGPLCRSVRDALRDYPGDAAVMSFDPCISGWFARHAPGATRGLVLSEQDRRGLRGRLARRLSLIVARPDFIACDVRDLPSRLATRMRSAGKPVLAWTVRGPADEATAAAYADQPIYEQA